MMRIAFTAIVLSWVLTGPAKADAVAEFWKSCLPSLPAPPADGFYRVRSIGGTPETTDIITNLILAGDKTGTFTSPLMYEGDRSIAPEAGAYFVLTDSTAAPRAVLQTTGLLTLPFNRITEKETAVDGPAVRSLEEWTPIHVTFFTNALKSYGKVFSEEIPVTVEKFKVVCSDADL
ncbi:MAG: ASCH domain-containing protein [Rhodospirillaceae bacterium]|nr:ASCH domain-containing protein [Rhodospirillaceae bacterium]